MISSNAKVDKKYIFDNDKEIMDKVMKDIIAIRNLKANNNITKDAFVKLEVSNGLESLYKSQLKIQDDKIINEEDKSLLNVNYTSNNINITYYYKGQEIDNSKILEEIDTLKKYIERRKNLLSNENYVNKAPKNIVDLDRKKLEEEENRLAQLINKN